MAVVGAAVASMGDPEDRELGRHLRKRGQWRILVNWQVRSGTGRAL